MIDEPQAVCAAGGDPGVAPTELPDPVVVEAAWAQGGAVNGRPATGGDSTPAVLVRGVESVGVDANHARQGAAPQRDRVESGQRSKVRDQPLSWCGGQEGCRCAGFREALDEDRVRERVRSC